MAIRIKPAKKDLHDADFYVWALDQAELLRAQRFEALDLDNLIEEVEGLADVKRSAVLNAARVVIEPLLKLEHSPAQDPCHGWEESVDEHRSRLEIDLTPRLRQILADEIAKVYRLARRNAEAALRRHGEATGPAPTRSTRSPATGCRDARSVLRWRRTAPDLPVKAQIRAEPSGSLRT